MSERPYVSFSYNNTFLWTSVFINRYFKWRLLITCPLKKENKNNKKVSPLLCLCRKFKWQYDIYSLDIYFEDYFYYKPLSLAIQINPFDFNFSI